MEIFLLFSEVHAFLTEHAASDVKADVDNSGWYMWNESCQNLVSATLTQYTAAEGREMVQLIYNQGYMRGNMFSLLQSVMSAYLKE